MKRLCILLSLLLPSLGFTDYPYTSKPSYLKDNYYSAPRPKPYTCKKDKLCLVKLKALTHKSNPNSLYAMCSRIKDGIKSSCHYESKTSLIKKGEAMCDLKVTQFKNTLRECFSLPKELTLTTLANQITYPSSNFNCQGELKEIIKQYNSNSLLTLFGDTINHKDIIDFSDVCRGIDLKRYPSSSSPSSQENLNYEDNNRADLKDAGNNQENLNYGALIPSNREHQEEGALETTLNQEEMTLPSDQVEQDYLKLTEGSYGVNPEVKFNALDIPNQKENQIRSENKKVTQPKIILKLNKLTDKEKRYFLKNKYQYLTSKERATIRNSEEITKWTRADRIKEKEELKEQERIELESKFTYKAKKAGANILRGLAVAGGFARNIAGKGLNKVATLISKDAKAQSEFAAICKGLSLSQKVYQTVEAPQIEPLIESDNYKLKTHATWKKYLKDNVYNNYDLLTDKPVAVIVEITNSHPLKQKLKNPLKLSLSLNEGGEDKSISCLDARPLDDYEYRGITYKETPFKLKDGCVFNLSNESSIKKLIPLPAISRGGSLRNISIKLKIKGAKEECTHSISFNAKMYKQKELDILFTKINSKANCRKYRSPSNVNIINRFIKSREMTEGINKIFPFLAKVERLGQDIEGHCKKRAVGFFRELDGYLEDIRELEELSLKKGGNRIIGITSWEYMKFHAPGAAGFMLPLQYIDILLGEKQVGSYHVAFVEENQIDSGTILHELGHTFKQNKEHYDRDYHCDKFIDPVSTSKNTQSYTACPKYRVTGGLIQFKHDKWGLLDNFVTIMNGLSDLYDPDTGRYVKWISRDTYQKAFHDLYKNRYDTYDFQPKPGWILPKLNDPYGIQPEPDQAWLGVSTCKKLIFSGLYHNGVNKDDPKKDGLNNAKGLMKDIKLIYKGKETSFSPSDNNDNNDKDNGNNDWSGNHLKIEIKQHNEHYQTIIFDRVAPLEIIYKNRGEKKTLNTFPVVAPIYLCDDSKDYKLSVIETGTAHGEKYKRTLLDSVSIRDKTGE